MSLPRVRKGWVCSSAVEHLPSFKAGGSSSSTENRQTKNSTQHLIRRLDRLPRTEIQ